MSALVWEATMDNRYRCRVERTSSHNGTLKIFDQDGTKLLEKEVSLTCGAVFGPDVDDVAIWQEMCEKAVNH